MLQSDKPTAAGGNGGSLGYTGIDKSVAIRISTYRSGYSPNAYDYNRVQIIADPPGGGQVGIVSADPLFDLNSGEPRFAWIDYDGKNDVIGAFVSQNDTKPANRLISEPFDLMSFVGTDPTYIGFTAANGSKTNDHNVTRWTFRSDAFPLKANPAGQTYVQELRAAQAELKGSIGILTGPIDDIILAEAGSASRCAASSTRKSSSRASLPPTSGGSALWSTRTWRRNRCAFAQRLPSERSRARASPSPTMLRSASCPSSKPPTQSESSQRSIQAQ